MINDWNQEIAVAWLVKQAIMEVDKDKIWTYHLPEVAATDEQIKEAEEQLGHELDHRYREFLRHANGWRGFVQTIDLFGTNDLIKSPRKETAEFTFSCLGNDILNKSGVKRTELLPIGATSQHADLFVMTRPFARSPGTVIWFAGEEVERFKTFDDYFLAMVDYNRLDLQRLKERQTNK